MRPELVQDWTLKQQSSASMSPTDWVDLRVDYYHGDGDAVLDATKDYYRQAGDYMVLMLDVGQVAAPLILAQRRGLSASNLAYCDDPDNPNRYNIDSNLGGVLYMGWLTYCYEYQQARKAVCGLTGGVDFQPHMGYGMVSSKTELQPLNWSWQYNCIPKDVVIDIQGNCANSISIDGTTGFDAVRRTIIGMSASAEENAVWEEVMNTDSISAVKSIALARMRSIPLDVINSSNQGLIDLLNQPDAVKANVRADVLGGATVTIPHSPTDLNDWHGVGWFADWGQGYIGYYIQRNLAAASQGGATTEYPHLVDPIHPRTPQALTQAYVGDPINAASGNICHQETDVSLPGPGFPITFSRTYNSEDPDDLVGGNSIDRGMSDRWSYSYSDRIEWNNGTGNAIWYTDTGDRLRFTPSGWWDGSHPSATYNTPDSIYGSLQYSSGTNTWTWTDNFGNKTTFAGNTLSRIEDRYGNGVSVTHDSNGMTIADLKTPSRSLRVNMSGYRVNTVVDFTGRPWTYGYSSGLLNAVTAPSDAQTPHAVVYYGYHTGDRLGGLLKTIIDPNGGVTDYAYYANRRGYEVTDPLGNIHGVSYNDYRKRTSFTDECGVTGYYAYNDQGNLLEELHPDRTTIAYEWQDGVVRSITDEFGQKDVYDYETGPGGKPNGNLETYTDRGGHVTAYTYTDYANVETITRQGDPANPDDSQTTIFTYYTDAFGKDSSLKEICQVLDGNTTYVTGFTYPATGNRGLPETKVAPKGYQGGGTYTTSYTYNAAGQVLTESSTLESSQVTVTHSYDDRGNLTSSTDGNENTTAYPQYDLLNRLKLKTWPDPDGPGGPLSSLTLTSNYDPLGNLTSTVDNASHTTSYSYDGRQRLLKITNADSTYRIQSYDPAGKLVAETDELGRVTRYVYDARKRCIATMLPDGTVVRTAYDGGGRVARVTDGRGNAAEYLYDELDREVQETLPDPDGSAPGSLPRPVIYSKYDGHGNLEYLSDTAAASATDPNHSTQFVYDGLNRKVAGILPDPDGSGPAGRPTTYFGYDANGNLTYVTDARGAAAEDPYHTATFQYDELDRKVREILPDPDGDNPALSSPETVYTYDANGNLSEVLDPRGFRTRYLYDKRDRCTKVTDALGSSAGDPAHTTVTLYDANGNVTSVVDPRGYTTWYQYDPLNRPIQVTDAQGSYSGDPNHTAVTTYDALGNVQTIEDPLGRTTSYEYDNLSRKIKEIQPQFERYDSQQVSPTTYYGYDANGNLKYVTGPRGSAARDSSYTTWYFYDNVNRSTVVLDATGLDPGPNPSDWEVVPADPSHSIVTAYDIDGNVSSVTDQLGRVSKSEYDNLNRKTEDIAPDPAGNPSIPGPTTQYAYNPNGDLISVTDPLSHATWYNYDGLGRRTHEVSPLGSGSSDFDHATITTYDAVGQVVSVIDAQNNETAYAYDLAGQLVCQTGPAGQVSFFGYDAAGNLLQKTDGNHRVTQYTIDALGRRVEERWLDGQAQVIRTIRTKYDSAGQLWAIEETGSTASQAGATYYFEYDQDGNLRRSLVAPPDLAQPASTNMTTTPDYIANNESSKDYPVSFSLGTAVTIDLTSSRFDPHLKVVAPSGQFLEDAGNTTHASLQFVAQETGTWHVIVTSDTTLPPTNRSFTLATTENTFNALAKLEYGYDEAGNLKKTTDSSTVVSNVNGTTAYDYDALQRLTRTTQSGANVAPKQADFAYNNAGQPLTISRFASTNGTAPVATTNYTTYDGMGRLKEMNHQKDQTSLATYSWQFDAASRVTQMVSLADGTNNFTYDNADELQTASNPAENYTYDDNGNRTNAGYSTDPGNRLADDGVYTYQYDNEGNRTLRTKTADGSMTEYGWDHRNRLVSVTERPAPLPSSQWASTVIAFSTQFTDTNWSAAQALGAPNVPYYADYFQAWAPSSKDGTTESITLGYSTPVYANAVTVRESYGNGFVTNVEVRNAATGAFESVWSGTDPSQPGSLVDFTVTFATRSYLVDAVRVTTNTSHSAVWEEIDAVQLSGLAIAPATKAVEYTYDAFGQRIRRTIDADGAGSGPAVYTYNVYSGGEAVLEIKDLDGLANPAQAPTRNHRYFYGAAVDQVLASEDAAQAVLWGLADHEGTIRDVVDSSGTVVDHRTFDGFGKITDESAPATDFLFGYTGRPQDAATGLDDYRGRWYDPAVGRFASEDPAGFAAGDANLYRYVGNNPLTHTDPSGLGGQPLSRPMSFQSANRPWDLTVEERLALSRERAQREVDYFYAKKHVVDVYGRGKATYLEYLERMAEVAAEYGDLLLLERCRQAYAWELAHPRTQSKRGVGRQALWRALFRYGAAGGRRSTTTRRGGGSGARCTWASP